MRKRASGIEDGLHCSIRNANLLVCIECLATAVCTTALMPTALMGWKNMVHFRPGLKSIFAFEFCMLHDWWFYHMQAETGKLVFGGAYNPNITDVGIVEGALFIFKDTTPAEIEAFVAADPYVVGGLVPSWSIKPYNVVVEPN